MKHKTEEPKFCPLLSVGSLERESSLTKCLGDRCALWVERPTQGDDWVIRIIGNCALYRLGVKALER